MDGLEEKLSAIFSDPNSMDQILSIAKSLTQLMGGIFFIGVDGDLFKASITFPMYRETIDTDE